ncbi:MAG: MarR family transcriptional regulator [Proteobacteria bacterium]|nr:MarR family transcriptional regulator [Pseudomonadota bacterium]
MNDKSHLDLERYLPYLIHRVGTAIAEAFTADALAAQRLSIAMWRVLVVLDSNGAQRQIDLARLTSIDVSTLSRLISRLVRLGLVARIRSKTSNREVMVGIKAKGRALLDRLIPRARSYEVLVGAGVPAADLARVKTALRRMYANMAAHDAKQAGRKRAMKARAAARSPARHR